MDINSVPEAKKKITISVALIVFLLIGVSFLTRYLVKYDMETKAKIEALSKPKTEDVDANQLMHVDESLHKLELENVKLKNRLVGIEDDIEWLRANCRCRE